MTNKTEHFIKLEFTNGKDITENQFSDEYKKGNYFIYIELNDQHWAPNIYLPNSDSLDPIMGSVVHITSTATKQTKIYGKVSNSNLTETISKDETVIVLGNPDTGWRIIKH